MKWQRTAAVVVILAMAMTLAGCLGPMTPVVPPDDEETAFLSLEQNYYGWVTLRVDYDRGVIHWGDGFAFSQDSEAYTTVTKAGLYTHYYSTPAVYAVRLFRFDTVIDTVTAPVDEVRGHVELIDQSGLDVTVKHYGIDDGREYTIEWGDGSGTIITVSRPEDITSDYTWRRHRYDAPGTYTIGIRCWGLEPYTACVTISAAER